MKKIKLLGMIISVMFLWFVGQPMEAHADAYIWASNGESASWYQGYSVDETKKMDSAPSNLTEEDHIIIDAEPNEEVRNFCENLSGCLNQFSYAAPTSLTVGNGNNSLDISSIDISNDKGELTLNLTAEVTIIDVINGTLTMNGNVNTLRLHGNYSKTTDSSVTINGEVLEIVWYKDNGKEDNEQCYCGDVLISGSVSTCKIFEYIYDETLEQYGYHQTGLISSCDEGIFEMRQGVLADSIEIIPIQPIFENYYISYGCFTAENLNMWNKHFMKNGEIVATKACMQEDIPEGADITIQETAQMVVFEQDLNKITFTGGEITVNGNVKSVNVYDATGYADVGNINIFGNVEWLTVTDWRNGKGKRNIYVEGKVNRGTYGTAQGYMGEFECTATQIMKEGILCVDLFLNKKTDSGEIQYIPIQKTQIEEALKELGIGNETVVGEQTIVKEAWVDIQAAYESVVETISKIEAFNNALAQIKEDTVIEGAEYVEVSPICGVEIAINSMYVDKETGNQYQDDVYGKEKIIELPTGKEIIFTIKVPNEYYDSKAKYTIVRHHTKEDGTDEIEVLKTTQEGDALSFASDKFSTFVIVEVAEKIDTVITIKNVDDTVVKEDGIFGNGTFSLSDLIAGTYTFIATRENYVPRTYTVEVETDLETVELDVELHKTGDVTGDNTINARDKKMLFNHIAGTAILEDYDFAVGDVTGDGTLNARDKKMVFNHIAGTSSLWN